MNFMAAAYDDEIGWIAVDDVLTVDEVQSVRASSEDMLESIGSDLRVGDKPHSGTRRLVDVVERIPQTGVVLDRLAPVIRQILGDEYELAEGTYRCPQPGFGRQLLHADDVPRLSGGPNLVATAIVTLAEFTEHNGATRLVPGSNRRIDLQRRSGDLEYHRDEIALTGPAGRAFVFCGHTLHSGTQNNSDRPRPALQLVFRAVRPSGR